MLPILTVLFLLSYGLMTLLIVEQGSTIQSQRAMIQLLLGDSSELFAMKAKNAQQTADMIATRSVSRSISPSTFNSLNSACICSAGVRPQPARASHCAAAVLAGGFRPPPG